jgi:CBS domain-containing protein
VRPETTIDELTELMTVYDYNGFPVVDGDDILQGLVTRTDLFKLYLEPYRRPVPGGPAATVARIMSRGVIVLRAEDRVSTAIALMVEHHVTTIPIVTPTLAGPRVVGIITRRDAAGALKP